MDSKQVVLITGSSTGFGRLFAETLARKGHTVFATMRDLGGRKCQECQRNPYACGKGVPAHSRP